MILLIAMEEISHLLIDITVNVQIVQIKCKFPIEQLWSITYKMHILHKCRKIKALWHFHKSIIRFFVTIFKGETMNMQIQSEEYKKYMSSSKWHQIKNERIKIDNNACAMCGYSAKPQVLMVHHMNYARL